MGVVDAMLGNAAVAAVLAVMALGVGLLVRSPAVRHVAWVLVLLKFVTPPIVTVPLPVLPATWAEKPAEQAPTGAIQFTPTAPAPVIPATRGLAPEWRDNYRPQGAVDWALVAWVAGAVMWFAWQGRRVVRFRRRVAKADAATPELADVVRRIAAELGIARPPTVRLAAGIASPMLWGWGRATVILFPRELLARLSPEARDTLLAHELAHYLRRDHWVRVLEFVASGLYWWHPVVWIARTQIEAAEEECCDAWVVGGLAASPRKYAEALLATVDYAAELQRPRLPPGACAANRSVRLLHRRLVGIINARRPTRTRGVVAFRALAVAALVTQPVLRAATPGDIGSQAEPVAVGYSPSPGAPTCPPPRRTVEPRAWASASAPHGGLTVVARDHEVILRRPEGTSAVLGPGRPLALAFAPGGRRLATAGPGALLRTWDDRGRPIAEAHTPVAARSVSFTPDGTRLLALDADGGVSVLDAETLSVVSRWAVDGPANSLTLSPDGVTVAIAFGSWLSETGWVELWSIPDRRRIASYSAAGPVGAVRFTPDASVLIVGGWNGSVAWRSLPTGELITTRQLPKDMVAAAAFSPDAGTLPLDPPPELAPPPSPVLPPDMLISDTTFTPEH